MRRFNRSHVLAAISLSLVGSISLAAEEDAGGPPRRWGVGVASIVTDSAYAGEGTRFTPIPLVTYEGDRLFFRGITAGWRFLKADDWTVAAIAQGRLDGFDIKDLGRSELASNGLDYALLDDRKDGLDLGGLAEWEGRLGEVSLEVLADVTSASEGIHARLQYGYPVQFGKTRLTPQMGVHWHSKKSANYYYGTLDEEVGRRVSDYKPGAASMFNVGVNLMRPVGERWLLLASLDYRLLPDKIRDSPLIEDGRNGEASVMIGFARSF